MAKNQKQRVVEKPDAATPKEVYHVEIFSTASTTKSAVLEAIIKKEYRSAWTGKPESVVE